MIKTHTLLLLAFAVAVLQGCSKAIDLYTPVHAHAVIYPPYEGTTIPPNIAPLNFAIQEADCHKFVVRLVTAQDSIELRTTRNLNIPQRKWRKLLSANLGNKLTVKIFGHKNDGWIKFNDLQFAIAREPADPYIAYRLIEPGYELWGQMGLYQRCIENFDERPIITNALTDNGCMNCHSFKQNNPHHMVFHVRGKHAGTIVAQEGKVKKVNTKLPESISAGVYPRWHPQGGYVAFSTNRTSQGFLAAHTNKVEVFDAASDLVLYNTQTNKITTTALLHSPHSYETFPEWSPAGDYLYFCSAPALTMPNEYRSLRYDLLRIAFDAQTGTFSTRVDTLVSARQTGKSVAMPRVSPDGNHLVFCMADYGTFPIWHRENNLYQLNLHTGQVAPMTQVNSSQTDSYHSWSANGRWLLFSSRRLDESYTRLYIAYFDEQGRGHKPILLPQKHPDYYAFQLKSYNIPEFMTGKIDVSPYELQKAIKGQTVN